MKKLLIPAIACLLLIACGKEQKMDAKANTDSLPVKQQTKALPVATTTGKSQNAISNPKFNPELLYGTWTLDNNGPHADFELSKKSFYVVDYDGDGDRPYSIHHDTITVQYEDHNSVGVIKKAVKDTLVINWDNVEDMTYVTWKG